ncbi:MAG: alkaline phosphatase family protein, partial [bacterium]|nr:alkaline phosphatase family protein [bacterium]
MMISLKKNRNLNKRHRPWHLNALVLTFGIILFSCVFILSVKVGPVNADTNRLIMLGFDGMDYKLVSQYMDEGYLPNLTKLRDSNTFSRLWSTYPPESPVAWSAMITGTNPGKTGIFDFLRRDPETYFPVLNMTNTVSPMKVLFNTIPIKAPVLENARHGDPYWVYAANNGVKSVNIM